MNSSTRILLAIILGSLLGCSKPDSPPLKSAENVAQPKVVEERPKGSEVNDDTKSPEDDLDLELAGPEVTRYMECHSADAEIVLALFVTIPKLMENRPYRFPLCRHTVRENELDLSGTMYCSNGDGRAPDGSGLGHGFGISLNDFTDSSLTVSFSAYWTASDKSTGSFKERLKIIVGQESKKDFGNGVEIRWNFEAPTDRR